MLLLFMFGPKFFGYFAGALVLEVSNDHHVL